MVYYLTPSYAARPKKDVYDIPPWAYSLVISLIVIILVWLLLNTIATMIIHGGNKTFGDEVIVVDNEGKQKTTYKLKQWVTWTIFGISVLLGTITHAMILKEHNKK